MTQERLPARAAGHNVCVHVQNSETLRKPRRTPRRLRRAPDGKLLVIEMTIPDDNRPSAAQLFVRRPLAQPSGDDVKGLGARMRMDRCLGFGRSAAEVDAQQVLGRG
jgi:hypothetical protein